MSLHKQRGVVIVVALFIVALVATMAYIMMARLERDTRRSTLILREIQASHYAQGSVIWAIDHLRNNWEQQKQNQVIDRFPMQSPKDESNGYTIVSTIQDMQARVNLNGVSKKEGQQSLSLLVQAVAPKMSAEQIKRLMQSISQWVTGMGKESSLAAKYYLQLKTPYRLASRPMISISELRLVKGMTPDLYHALEPYITALPDEAKINVQTALAPVLMSLSPTLTLEAAKRIEEVRKQAPFISISKFSELDMVKNHQVADNNITVVSQYFLVETDVTIENQHIVLYTLLERKTKERKAQVNILWQSKGVW